MSDFRTDFGPFFVPGELSPEGPDCLETVFRLSLSLSALVVVVAAAAAVLLVAVLLAGWYAKLYLCAAPNAGSRPISSSGQERCIPRRIAD